MASLTRVRALWIAVGLLVVSAATVDPHYFWSGGGWVGALFVLMGAAFFRDVLLGGKIGIAYWRVPDNPSRLTLACAFLVAGGMTIFGVAAMFRSTLQLLRLVAG